MTWLMSLISAVKLTEPSRSDVGGDENHAAGTFQLANYVVAFLLSSYALGFVAVKRNGGVLPTADFAHEVFAASLGFCEHHDFGVVLHHR